MEIPINASLGNNRDEALAGPITEDGGGSGSRPDAEYRKMLDGLLSQVIGKRDFDNAYASFTMAARSHVELGMPYRLMCEYQDKLADHYARLQRPVAPVQHIDQLNQIEQNTGPLKGNVGRQDFTLGKPLDPDPDPKLLE